MLAAWKPPWITKVRVPVPLHAVHVDRFAPGLSPVALHGVQSTTTSTSTVLETPLHASKKLTLKEASMSPPRGFCVDRGPPELPPNAPNNWSKRSCWPPIPPIPPPPPKGLKPPWKPNPPPPKDPPALAKLGSNPGCVDAAPYLSYIDRFCSSFKI